MRGIVEIVIAITLLFGGGAKLIESALYNVKKLAGEKIIEHGNRLLARPTMMMTKHRIDDKGDKLLIRCCKK